LRLTGNVLGEDDDESNVGQDERLMTVARIVKAAVAVSLPIWIDLTSQRLASATISLDEQVVEKLVE
jgi:hypothetical protein